MGEWLAKAEELEKKAEKKLTGSGLFRSKCQDAADLFAKAANYFKLAKSCDIPQVSKLSFEEAVSCFDHAVNLLCDTGGLYLAASYLMNVAELYESEQNIEQAVVYYEKSADLYEIQEVRTSANHCKQKVAQFAFQLEQYQKSIVIYEEIACQSLNNNLLKYGVKGHLLNAGICQLCKGDPIAITNALERYQDIAAAVDDEDVGRFTDVVKEFDSMTPLDSWKETLLLKLKEKLKAKEKPKAKELEEDDLTLIAPYLTFFL